MPRERKRAKESEREKWEVKNEEKGKFREQREAENKAELVSKLKKI